MAAPKTIRGLMSLLPDAHIEEVGDRRELVIYTGWSIGTYDADEDRWTDTPHGRLVPMPEFLD